MTGNRTTEMDEDIYARLVKSPDTRRGVDALAWEVRHGDADGRRRADRDLRNLGVLNREIAAIKRWIKR